MDYLTENEILMEKVRNPNLDYLEEFLIQEYKNITPTDIRGLIFLIEQEEADKTKALLSKYLKDRRNIINTANQKISKLQGPKRSKDYVNAYNRIIVKRGNELQKLKDARKLSRKRIANAAAKNKGIFKGVWHDFVTGTFHDIPGKVRRMPKWGKVSLGIAGTGAGLYGLNKLRQWNQKRIARQGIPKD